MPRFKYVLIAILLGALLVRLYKVTTPLADWHSFRQADTASVTREYYKNGIDLLRPRYHDLSNIQSGERTGGKDNVEGYRMVEFPIVNAILALILRAVPGLDLVITSRIASIFASLVTITAIAWIGRRLFSPAVGLCAAIVFAFTPYMIFYSRVILPEPFLIAMICVSLVALIEYVRLRQQESGYSWRAILWLVAWLVAFAIALLIKPMAIFYAPAMAWIVWSIGGWRVFFDPALVLAAALACAPLLWWRTHIANFPSGIPASDWLFNSDKIRFRPAWWRWLVWERLSRLMLGMAIVPLFVAGFFLRRRPLAYLQSGMGFILFAGLGLFAYLSIIATGNVRHDYYQVLLTPLVALLVGRGMNVLWKSKGLLGKLGVCIMLPLGWFIAWKQVGGYYNINNPAIVAAGKYADATVPPDAKIIAPYMGDTAFLFQTNRIGWPIGFDIETKRAEGATHYLSVSYDDEARELEQRFRLIEKNDQFILIDIQEAQQ